MTDRPIILLAAHGERGGAGQNARLAALVETLSARFPDADVGSVLVNIDGLVERTLAACGDRPVLVLPLLFSDGFFYAERLKPHVVGPRRRLAPPLAFWPGFAPLLADNLALRLISSSVDPRVILVAHGSKTPNNASAASAHRVAAQLQARYGAISVGFLEQAPFASDLAASVEPPYSIVGLFLGEGRHGGDDFDVLAASARAPPVAAFTAGHLPGLGTLVGDEAETRLAELLRAG